MKVFLCPEVTENILDFKLHSSYLPTYEDGTDSVFQNVGI